jgi:hypothetical protein
MRMGVLMVPPHPTAVMRGLDGKMGRWLALRDRKRLECDGAMADRDENLLIPVIGNVTTQPLQTSVGPMRGLAVPAVRT